jgi:hypothetical protein
MEVLTMEARLEYKELMDSITISQQEVGKTKNGNIIVALICSDEVIGTTEFISRVKR